MSSQDKPRKPQRAREEREERGEQDAAATGEPVSPFRNAKTNSGARVWVLPTITGDAWAVAEESDPRRLALALCENPPSVLSMRVPQGEQPDALRFAGESMDAKFRERSMEGTFALVSRLVLSAGWLLVALLGLRLPGEVKFFDQFLLLTGTGFLAYTIFRYGLPLGRWRKQQATAVGAFAGGNWQHSKLLDRISSALKLRKELKVEQRGQSPDAELLDANAYRKLIRDGICTAADLSALGLAIETSMKLISADNQPRKIADVARECGIDTDTAIFYRDLASAAADIRLDEMGIKE